jgi:putative membrane protein
MKHPFILAATGAGALIALLGASDPRAAGADATFADKFYQAGLAEIGLAKVAMTKSTNPDVLAFARKMVHDHSKADAKLTTIASADQISLPETVNPKDAATKSKLENTPASEFDAAYKAANEKGHEKAIALIKTEISSGADPKVVGYAKMVLPTVETHDMLADKLPTR